MKSREQRMLEIDDQLFERLVAYVDGELTESEAKKIEEMIAADLEIRTEVDRLRESRGVLIRHMKVEAKNTPVPKAWLDLVAKHREPRFLKTGYVLVGLLLCATLVLILTMLAT